MKAKNLLKKAFLLLALVGGATSAWATDYGTFIVKFESTPSQSRTDGREGDFFTYSGASTSYTGKYADVDLTDSSKGGLKLNSTGWLRFTTLAPSNIIIVQSDDKNADKGIKINGTGNTSGVANATDGVVVFTLNNQAAGSYEILRNGSEVGIIYVKVEYTEAPIQTYNASFANGGHGTAPSAQEDVAFVTLPTIGENFYTITGWKANQDVTVDEATVTAGTLIAVGKNAYLSSNTTFTAQWEESDYPYVDGITFPASLPATALDMRTQDVYTPTNGYVVLEPKADVLNGGDSKNFWLTYLNANSSNVKWTAPDGSKYPSSASDETSLLALRNNRTFAFKFTGTTEFEAMLNPRKDTYEAHVLVVDMTDKSIVDNLSATTATESSKVAALTTDHIKTFSDLDATHTYVAFFYSTCDNTNGVIYGIALKQYTVSATIGEKGYTTFSSSYPLNLDGISGGTAYKVVALGVSSSEVTPTEATGNVAAGEGLILAGDADATVTIPVVASGSAISGNLMVGCPTATTITNETANYNNFYVLVNGTSEAVFKNLKDWIGGGNSVTIPEGKAYLDATGTSGANQARGLRISFGGITGVENVEAAEATVKKNGAYLENGKIAIYKNGMKFNANGQLIK